MVAAVQERLEPYRPVTLHHFCSPHHRDSMLHPFVARIEHAAGFDRDEAAASKLEKLRSLWWHSERATPAVTALFADLLGLPCDGWLARSASDPRERRESTF